MTPLCKQPKGCEIQAEARDPQIHAIVASYMRMRTSATLENSPTMRERFLAETGLSQDLETLIAMDQVFGEFLEQQREQKRRESRGKGGRRKY